MRILFRLHVLLDLLGALAVFHFHVDRVLRLQLLVEEAVDSALIRSGFDQHQAIPEGRKQRNVEREVQQLGAIDEVRSKVHAASSYLGTESLPEQQDLSHVVGIDAPPRAPLDLFSGGADPLELVQELAVVYDAVAFSLVQVFVLFVEILHLLPRKEPAHVLVVPRLEESLLPRSEYPVAQPEIVIFSTVVIHDGVDVLFGLLPLVDVHEEGLGTVGDGSHIQHRIQAAQLHRKQ